MTSNDDVDLKEAENIESRDEPTSWRLYDFPQFTDYQERMITWAMQSAETDTLINKYGIIVTAKDIHALFPKATGMNDNVIKFYMKLLSERSRSRKNDGYPQVFGMVPMDFSFAEGVNCSPNLLALKVDSEVDSNTDDVDKTSFHKLLIPVHINKRHWCLTIIDVKEKTIKHYDSARWLKNFHNMLPAFNEYLKENYCKKYLGKLDISNWLTENVNDIPLQRKRYGCGVYTCMTAEFLCRSRQLYFAEDDMEYFRRKMILEIVTGNMML